MAAFILNKLCKGCQRCMKACPNGAIYKNISQAIVDPAKCTECEECVEVCMHGAITIVQNEKSAER